MILINTNNTFNSKIKIPISQFTQKHIINIHDELEEEIGILYKSSFTNFFNSKVQPQLERELP